MLWPAGCIAGYFYSQLKSIPSSIAIPALAALLVELSLYAGTGFREIRQRWEALGSWLPVWMTGSAVVPYLIYSLPVEVFRWEALIRLAALAAILAFWYLVLPRNPAVDAAFLVLTAGVVFSEVLRGIYVSRPPELEIAVLGQLMWIRCSVIAALLLRRMEGVGFGFLPSAREWIVGLKYFGGFIPLGFVLMYGLDFARFDPAEGWWWKAPATFLGILWVVALSEEFFFRGMLQQWLMAWVGRVPGWIVAALLFGAAHLSFREFPNWKFASLAAVAGVFYGRAFLEGGGIRAPMVAHALVVTVWRTLFR